MQVHKKGLAINGIKEGWPSGRPQCWNWKSASEIKLLEQIKAKADQVTLTLLENFEELPVNFWGWVPETRSSFPIDKILALVLASIDIFWSTNRTVYADRRIKSIKKSLKDSLISLELSWRKDEETVAAKGSPARPTQKRSSNRRSSTTTTY